jgi:hypothetical protein
MYLSWKAAIMEILMEELYGFNYTCDYTGFYHIKGRSGSTHISFGSKLGLHGWQVDKPAQGAPARGHRA